MAKNFAATRPVNSPGVEPKLTIEQLWAGLAKKAREPKDFIPNVASVIIVEDSGDKIVREVVFRNEDTGETKLTEHITLNKPTSVNFHAQTPEQKIYITNLISFDKESNLQLSFSFVGGMPGEANPGPVEEMSQKAGMAVEKTIAHIRALVNKGVF